MNYLSDGGSYVKFKQHKNQLLIVFLVAGFFSGIIYENLISKSQGMSIQIFQSYFLSRYTQTKIIVEEYLWYVMQVRVIPFIAICILGCLKWKKLLTTFWLAWTGFLSGVLTVSAVMHLGIKGILICMVGFFPHIICYGLAYGILLIYLYQYPENQWNGVKTIFVVLMMFLGIMLEAYLNPILLRFVLRII